MTEVSVYPYVEPKRPRTDRRNRHAQKAKREREAAQDALMHAESAPAPDDVPEEQDDRLHRSPNRTSADLRYRFFGGPR